MEYNKKPSYNLPPDYNTLNEDDIIDFYSDNFVRKQYSNFCWPFVYTPPILVGSHAIQATILSLSYYRMLKIPRRGKLLFCILAAAIGGCLTIPSSLYYPVNDVILQKNCSFCVNARAIVFHALPALFSGLVAAPVFCLQRASTEGYCPELPSGYGRNDYRKFWNLYVKMTKKIVPKIVISTTLNAILIMFLINRQYIAFDRLNLEISTRTRKLNKFYDYTDESI